MRIAPCAAQFAIGVAKPRGRPSRMCSGGLEVGVSLQARGVPDQALGKPDRHGIVELLRAVGVGGEELELIGEGREGGSLAQRDSAVLLRVALAAIGSAVAARRLGGSGPPPPRRLGCAGYAFRCAKSVLQCISGATGVPATGRSKRRSCLCWWQLIRPEDLETDLDGTGGTRGLARLRADGLGKPNCSPLPATVVASSRRRSSKSLGLAVVADATVQRDGDSYPTLGLQIATVARHPRRRRWGSNDPTPECSLQRFERADVVAGQVVWTNADRIRAPFVPKRSRIG